MTAEAFFLPAAAGARYCVFHPAAGACRGALLYVHPFAEEMHKSRRMAALAARALAASGIAVLQIDLHGCGDSSGEFADARWDAWKEDLAAGLAWLRERTGMAPGLWGLRLGALLALDYARGASEAPRRLLLWQPVLNGATFLTQFLRLRLAAAMLDGDTGRGGVAALRGALQAGETLEVAGYTLTPALAADLDGLDGAAPVRAGVPVHWFEVVADAQRLVPPAAATQSAHWRLQGTALQLQLVPGPSFWNTQEIAESAGLVAATVAACAEDGDAA
ncbi:hydrolase 2, exosortase A system-associated [Massilia sp. R2A-15]|uniref:hydrolase 2, exosortase A system-associated n=1 Tax=Massilia sp. R2A-15 TaxID=3064278 RepID=UPI0027357758|nr:hydrolase 2, exosortase A system-associated [Massilia sp. R2A-15]WLI88924.1 hydrolase 2, exosortase A system-associated [Massilia sp. R2A-15]